MKYKVELAEFHTIEIEAENKEEAEYKVAVMDDEDILKQSVKKHRADNMGHNGMLMMTGKTEKWKQWGSNP